MMVGADPRAEAGGTARPLVERHGADPVLGALDEAFAGITPEASPFPHAILPDFYDEASSRALLSWLEDDATWEIQESSFYVQHRCTNLEALRASPCAGVVAPEVIARLVEHLDRLFSTELDRWNVTVAAHKLVPGQGIGLHTDEPLFGSETHRLVLHFCRRYEDSFGGHLMLFHERDPSAVASVIRPLHNVGAAFELSDRSFHAVNDVSGGVRYSLVFGFWREGAARMEVGAASLAEPLRLQDSESLVAFLRELGADRVPHSSRNLLEHLAGTAAIVQRWGGSPELCRAALFHSVYGTTSFNAALLTPEARGRLAEKIGPAAERLVYLFCYADRLRLFRDSSGDPARVSLRDGRGEDVLDPAELRQLRLLILANALDQAPFMRLSAEEACELREELIAMAGELPDHARRDLEERFGSGRSR